MTDFIEQRIINAVRELLTGRVNDLLGKMEIAIPIIEFGDFGSGYAVSPKIELTSCERTEKERVIRLDAYRLTITFNLPDTPESEVHCFAYSGAISSAVNDDPTLGGDADRAVITEKKYTAPKKLHCGEGWGLAISLRVTIDTVINEQ